MAKGQSPLLGYNTNVRHKGRVFHIQTEDSGVAHPHVITHLFADGGRILKSIKTSYAELLEAPDMQAQVKKIMQDQHKAMFIALRDGQYDHLIDPDSTMGTPALQTGKHAAQPGPAAPPSPVRPPTPTESKPSTGAAAAVPAAPGAPARPVVPPPSAVPGSGAAAQPPPVPAAAQQRSAPSTAAMPAAPSGARPPVPTPAPAGDAGRASVTPGTASQPPASRSGRYAPVRAPEILGSFKPKPESTSIFGDGLMSEKSLDEVILAYLADDLDEPKR